MINKRRRVFFYITFAAFVVIAGFIVNFILNDAYRKQLPGNTNFTALSKPIGEQLSKARRQAYLFTSANNIGKLGMVYQSFGNNRDAAECYKLAAKKDPDNWIWYYYLGYIYLEQGELNAAVESFTLVTKINPRNNFALYYTGEAYQKMGLNENAERSFRKIIGLNNGDAVEINADRQNYFPLGTYATFQLARIYVNSGSVDSAETMLKNNLRNQLSFGPAYRLLGNVYKLKGDSASQKKYSARANDLIDYTPPSSKLIDDIALLSRSDAYLFKQIDDAIRSNNDRLALKLCENAIDFFPGNKHLISKILFTHLRLGNDEQALLYVDKHIKFFSDDARELMDAMDFLYSRGQYDESLKYFNQAIKILPNNSSLVMWLFERGKKKEAIVLMSQLVKANPEDEKILADIILILLEMGDEEQAKMFFAKLKLRAPKGSETLKVTGLFSEKAGDMKAALSAYERALQLGVKDLIFVKELSKAYVREKYWQQAIRHYKSALNIYPNDPELQEGLGRLLLSCPDPSMRDMNEGFEYLERAFINMNTSYKSKLDIGKTIATLYVSVGDRKNAVLFINTTVGLAKEKNLSEEYVNYFQQLINKNNEGRQ